MLSKLKGKRPDALIVMLITAVILAIFIPARGDFAAWFSTGTKFAVALLFYLYGARLSTSEALKGLAHWRLHAMDSPPAPSCFSLCSAGALPAAVRAW